MYKILGENNVAKIDDVLCDSTSYFEGDELAANVFATKYAIRDKDGERLLGRRTAMN